MNVFSKLNTYGCRNADKLLLKKFEIAYSLRWIFSYSKKLKPQVKTSGPKTLLVRLYAPDQ